MQPEPTSVPLAALEHYGYCARQAALIHVDAYFESNFDTVRGDIAHATVDRAGPDQSRHGDRTWHSLPVWSDNLSLHGICDTVEFHAGEPLPIEHKSGRYRPGDPTDLQVAGQVLCLREMFNAAIPHGVVFAGRDRRRYEVAVDDTLADRVAEAAAALRELIRIGALPPPVHDRRCQRCSLRPGCEPAMPTNIAGALFRPRLPDLTPDNGPA